MFQKIDDGPINMARSSHPPPPKGVNASNELIHLNQSQYLAICSFDVHLHLMQLASIF